MMEASRARPSGRDTLARHLASQTYEMAQRGGDWMVFTAVAVAALWIAGVALGFFGLGGMALSASLPPLLLAAAGIAAIVPAVLIVMAGFMARSSRRSAAANALVLEATSRLMAPAREAGTEGIAFAEQMKQAANEIDIAMAHAMSAMKAMADEVGEERLRLESVSYAASDNARELATRLAAERQALEALARELRGQMSIMSEAIPRQAQLMVSAARQASEEVGRADTALEARLNSMGRAGEDLGRRLDSLDGLAREAATRTETVTHSITRIEDKLEQSRRTVDAAVRASEVAAAAAATTGDALKGAVANAIDGARQANAEINAATRTAASEAERALLRLREAGEQAAYALRTASFAARIEGEGLERLTGLPQQEITPSLPPPSLRPSLGSSAPPLVNGHGLNGHSQTSDPPSGSNGKSRSSASRSPLDDDLFEASADAVIAASAAAETPARNGEPLMLRRRHEDPPMPPPEAPRRRASDQLAGTGSNGTGLNDIISDLSREDAGDSPDDREQTADTLVKRLESAGVLLGDVFRPKSKKRIAAASQKSHSARRDAVRDQARRDVERVSKKLRSDARLMTVARRFADLERGDALAALVQTQNTDRNASARLAAFLLVDAAL